MVVQIQPHMVGVPPAFFALRIVQLVFAVVIFGISIYGSLAGAIPGPALNLFTSLVTIIAIVYFLVARYGAPVMYQYWAILGLEIFCMIFWLVSFAVLASEVALAASVTCKTYTAYGYTYTTGCSSGVLELIGIFGACAGLGAIEFILFIATTALFTVGLTRHRANGGHSTAGAAATAAAGGAPPQKYEMSGQGGTYPTAPAPAAQGPPYQANVAPAPAAQGPPYQANVAPAAQPSPYQSYGAPAPGPHYQGNASPHTISTPLASPSPVSAQPVGSYSQTQDPRYGGGPPVHHPQQYQAPAAPQYASELGQHYQYPSAAEMASVSNQGYSQEYKQPQAAASQLP